MVDLFHEINEDLRADRANALWSKYGRWVIYLAISIVVVTAGAVYWKDRERKQAMNQTAVYFAAADMLSKGEANAALMMLNDIKVPEKSPYYSLVLLKKYEAYAMAGNQAEAKKHIDELARRKDAYGEVGQIIQRDAADKKPVKAAALSDSRNEWRAWELAEKGDYAQASQQFADIASSESAPATMRERASMMANYLKNKAGAKAND